MANRERGEVTFDACGQTWVLRYSTNALCALEGAIGKGALAAANEMVEPGSVQMSTLRAMMWAALSERHPAVDLKKAGELIDALGFVEAGAKLGEAFQLTFPVADEDAGEPGKPNPKA